MTVLPPIYRTPNGGYTVSTDHLPPKHNNRFLIDVVIPCHNYGRFLGEAIESVLQQTASVARILVIDDASDDNTAEVARKYASPRLQYMRVEHRNVYRTRMTGIANTRSPYIVFLDADDKLPSRYIEAAEKQMHDPRVGIVYSDLQHFGLSTARQVLDERDIEQGNFIHSAAMVRRDALTSVSLSPGGHTILTHDDWFLWRQVLRAGWKVAKSNVPLFYRKHGNSMMDTQIRTYRDAANLDGETIQIVLPLSGREAWLPRLQNWVEKQEWKNISVLVSDTGPEGAWRDHVKLWLASLPCETTYIPLDPVGFTANLERVGRPDNCHAVQTIMPQMYNEIRRRLNREYVMWVEDDILPPLNTISKLLSLMAPNVGCATGVVVSRYQSERSIMWDSGDMSPKPGRSQGVQRVYGSGFGCLLVRNSVLKEIPLQSGGRWLNYDQEFSAAVDRLGMQWWADWSVLCEHQNLLASDLPLRS